MKGRLTDRGVLAVSGPDAQAFLENLITNSLEALSPREARFSALLTPQGKYLASFFVVPEGDGGFWLDVAASEAPALAQRLTMYRLRSKVEIANLSVSHGVLASTDGEALPGKVYSDPRLPGLGHRAIAPQAVCEGMIDLTIQYTAHRLALGVPEPSLDLDPEKDFALEGLFDELHGIDFHKGCYVGQEMTSRMKRRTTVRQKLVPVVFDGEPSPRGTPITAGERDVGQIRTGIPGRAMALLRLDRVAEATKSGIPLQAGAHSLRVDLPDWVIVPSADTET